MHTCVCWGLPSLSRAETKYTKLILRRLVCKTISRVFHWRVSLDLATMKSALSRSTDWAMQTKDFTFSTTYNDFLNVLTMGMKNFTSKKLRSNSKFHSYWYLTSRGNVYGASQSNVELEKDNKVTAHFNKSERIYLPDLEMFN